MHIKIEVLDDIAVISLNRPRTNSMNRAFLEELQQRLYTVERIENIRVVIIKSLQPFGFSSGMDLGSFFCEESTEAFADNVYRAVEIVYKINRQILSSERIFICALSGPVIGSAASIAFSCDLRIAASNTWLWLPDPQYGGLLADGGIELLVRLVGASEAAALLLTNGRMNAQKAESCGLLYKTTEVKELDGTVMDVARRIAGYSSCSLGLSKKIINKDAVGSFRSEELKKVLSSGEAYERLQKSANKMCGNE